MSYSQKNGLTVAFWIAQNNKGGLFMSYYEDLFAKTELEKELNEKITILEESFHESPEYKAYEEELSQLNGQLIFERKRHIREVKNKYVGKRTNRTVPRTMLADTPVEEKEKSSIKEEKINEILKLVDSLTKEERELYVRKYNRKYEYKPLDDYENPTTTIQDIKDLQQVLIQSAIDFISDRNLTDIDEISFYFDSAQDSVKANDWSPLSDSSISVVGLQEEKDTGMTARRLIGKYY